jgi:hypothetical protein
MNMGPLWRVLQVQIVVDHLSAHPHLSSDSGNIHAVFVHLMNLLIACDPLLMKLLAFCFLILPRAGLPGREVLCLLLRNVL